MNTLRFLSLKYVIPNKVLLTLVYFFCLQVSQAFALPNCPKLLSHFFEKAGVEKQSASLFSKWNPENMPKVSPAHFLPPKFINEIEAKEGPLYLKIDKTLVRERGLFSPIGRKNITSWTMSIGAKYQDPFIMCTFYIDPNDSKSIILTGLELINPLPQLKNMRTHFSQDSKGLPYGVFQHLKIQLIHFLKAGGYSRIKATPQTYLVSKLYRKMIGFKPMNKKALETYSELDELYMNSKSSLIDIKQISSIDLFSRALGDHRINNVYRPYAEVFKIEQELKMNSEEFFEKNIPLYSPIDNQLMGVIYHSQYGERVYYFKKNTKPLQIINWRDLLESYSLSLELVI